MSLVEIMIVLAIMASVMGIVGVFARGAMINANIKKAQTEIGNLTQAVDAFFVFRGDYPQSLDQLANPPAGMAPIIQRVPKDPWSNDYQFERDRASFRIYSMGPDGSRGGNDDVCMEGDDSCN
jgi:general secretion pathway protein G